MSKRRFIPFVLAAVVAVLTSVVYAQQSPSNLTRTQLELERQQQRLHSSDPEERRDALMRLSSMRTANASRIALPALNDPVPMVRAVAAHAILSLRPDESISALLPLLNDKNEFVRREAAYALGSTHNSNATQPLGNLLLTDKEDGVRSAAAVALGEIKDESSVVVLGSVLSPELNAPGRGKPRQEKNPFVLRSVARSLGQIKSRAGTQALTAALLNEKNDLDVRREAAMSLGAIGDPGAVSALTAATTSEDPYLARAASESLRKISH